MSHSQEIHCTAKPEISQRAKVKLEFCSKVDFEGERVGVGVRGTPWETPGREGLSHHCVKFVNDDREIVDSNYPVSV